MKRIFPIILSFFSLQTVSAQLNIESVKLDKGVLHTKEDNVYALKLSSKKIELDVKIEYVPGSAGADDFEIISSNKDGVKLVSANSFTEELLLRIKKDSYDEKLEDFKIKFSYEINKTAADSTIEVHIYPAYNSPAKIMYLNAVNFDFGSTSLSSNYVGHLNLFAPSLGNARRWGFNTGVMKLNYGQNDSSVSNSRFEYVALEPYEEIKPGSKYIRQYNGYKTEKRNVVWSFYVQPLYELTNKDNNDNHIYLHLHGELLATKWTSKTTMSNIYQSKDTMLFDPNSPGVIRQITSNTSAYTINSLFGYFGLGATFNFRPWDGGEFFFQPTIGKTSNYPQPSAIDLEAGINSTGKMKPVKTGFRNTFYLVRGYYIHKINDQSTIVVGMDIRGLFPLYAPQYAAYVGINLSLDALLNLLKPSK
jgi:hypothetical protein